MHRINRLILFIGALLFVYTVSNCVIGFRLFMEPWEVDRNYVALTIFASVIICAPVWLAAVVPARFRIVSGILRWLGVAVLLLPLTTVVDEINRAVAFYPDPYRPVIFALVVMMGIYLSCLFVLVWPDVRRCLTFCGFLPRVITHSNQSRSEAIEKSWVNAIEKKKVLGKMGTAS